jgi:hypothetical protein
MQFGKRGRKKGIVGLTRINATPHSAKRQRQPQETHRRLKGSTGVWRQERWAIEVFRAELSTVQAAAVPPQQCFFESWVGARGRVGWQAKRFGNGAEQPSLPSLPAPSLGRELQGRALTTVTGRAGLVSVVVGEDQGGRVANHPCLTSFKLNRELILTAQRLRPLLLATVEERKSGGQCEVAQVVGSEPNSLSRAQSEHLTQGAEEGTDGERNGHITKQEPGVPSCGGAHQQHSQSQRMEQSS